MYGIHIGKRGGEEISNAKEIGGEESQRRAPKKAQEDLPRRRVYSGSRGRPLSKRSL